MDFKDQIGKLGERVEKLRSHLLTEEATKNALVLPFIQCLGYDVFNPAEVIPEFVADIGIKKGEKVDYAIMRDGKPCILIECKHIGLDLSLHNSQLFRYFHTTSAKFSILTNGVRYRFFTDLLEPNKMDEKPFLEFDITSLKEEQITEIRKFHQSYFNIEQISTIASELKYINEIRSIMQEDLQNPSEQLVRYYVNRVFSGRATEKVIQQFTDYIRRTSSQLTRDLINDKLQSVIDNEKQPVVPEPAGTPEAAPGEPRIVTTPEETEAYFIIKSIVREHVDAGRISHRDTQSYFGVLLDDNNRKPLCRLYLSGNKKYIGLFDAAKTETRQPVSSLDDLYRHAGEIIATLRSYLPQESLPEREAMPAV